MVRGPAVRGQLEVGGSLRVLVVRLSGERVTLLDHRRDRLRAHEVRQHAHATLTKLFGVARDHLAGVR